MSILIDRNSRVMVSGITGKEGTFHATKMMETGTNVVCGVTPGKGGSEHLGVPVYDSVEEALKHHEIDACGIFVPARFARAAADEAIAAGVKLVVVITEGINPHETIRFISHARRKGVMVLGPNTPGLLTPDEAKIGVLATELVERGRVGVVSRSGTLTVEICYYLMREGYGQSSIIGLGGDPVVGTSFTDIYRLFEEDPETDAVVVVGEIGGTMEEDLAEYIAARGGKKPAVAFIAGQNAPEGKRLGHAGAIIERGKGSAASKIEALTRAGVKVARVPWEAGTLVKEILG